MIQKPRGTMDILPEETPLWQYIERTARDVAARYGYEEIRTPTFEATELFARGVGDTTDVVQKEMYTFEDREKRSFTLRPEGTASVVRALIENGHCSDAMPLKLYYIISCFRYEKPEAGRSREFVQFGTEMFGAPGAAADFTIISLGAAAIRELGITNVKLHINSIGCPECRPTYRATLKEYLKANSDKLCDTCLDRMEMNPLRVLDCKNDSCKEVGEAAPKAIDHLCPECKAHFEELKRYLDAAGIEYEVDTHIVRGLDYYTRTVFEFIAEGIGAQSTVCGGGRYDGLTEQIGGPRLPGIGFAMGITRLIMAMEAAGITVPGKQPPKLYIASLGAAASMKALRLAEALRNDGLYVECDLVGRSLKAQMKYANKIGADYTLILGDNEIETGRAMLRSMKDSAQEEIALEELAEKLK